MPARGQRPRGASIGSGGGTPADGEAGDALARYRAKRRFDRTPEPAGDADADPGARFVVQRHEARRLHFDFRLELDGVLRSWAIPKGPSLDPAVRRLAVPTEDHPLAYADFEGEIAKGEYGAGRVAIWDRGTWRALGDARAGLRDGRLKFELLGERLRGGWSLIRTKPRAAGAPSRAGPDWLLIKEKDAHARVGAGAAADVSPAPTVSPERGARAPFPPTLAPMLASLREAAPPDEADWVWEPKWDGYRILARVDAAGEPRCFTRNGLDWSTRLRAVVSQLAGRFPPESWLDGELVVFDRDGVPDFGALQHALAGRPAAARGAAAADRELAYTVFDLPVLAGEDLREMPWHERRARLESLWRGLPDLRVLHLTVPFDRPPAAMLDAARRLGLEGLIGKRRDGGYASGRSADWIKLKVGLRQAFVIVGFTPGRGSRGPIGALALAVRAPGGGRPRFTYVGHVGSGIDARSLDALARVLKPLDAPDPRVSVGGPHPAGIRWVAPQAVAEVAFSGWTARDRLRHPVFKGLRLDRKPAEVVRAAAPDPTLRSSPSGLSPSRSPPPRAAAAPRITHPDRPVDASSGIDKRELVEYVTRAAVHLRDHLAGRPVALVRAPHGIGGAVFFQKHLVGTPIPGVRLLPRERDPGHAPLIELPDAASIAAAAQYNVVEFHTWNALGDAIETPDRIVLDLDPGEGVAWASVVEAAGLVRTLVEALDLVAFVKTSGGKGLHVVVPIERRHGWDECAATARRIAEHLATLIPGRFTAVSGPKRRIGRIFVDWLRNRRGATTVAAWSARARPGIGVSVPVGWDELERVRGGAHWTIRNVSDRLAIGDRPWLGYERARRTLAEALRRLPAP
ncbi:MAG: DNA ligase D [Lautropia sp.]